MCEFCGGVEAGGGVCKDVQMGSVLETVSVYSPQVGPVMGVLCCIPALDQLHLSAVSAFSIPPPLLGGNKLQEENCPLQKPGSHRFKAETWAEREVLFGFRSRAQCPMHSRRGESQSRSVAEIWIKALPFFLAAEGSRHIPDPPPGPGAPRKRRPHVKTRENCPNRRCRR